MAHPYRRSVRVDALLREEIARVVGEMKDPRVGFVTVMAVDTSPDLRHARVFVSILGDDETRQTAIDALKHAAGFVRSKVGAVVELRYLPELRFELDQTLKKAARIEALLSESRDVPSPGGNGEDRAQRDTDGE